MTEQVKISQPTPQALFYFIKTVGKITYDFINSLIPSFKKYDEDIKTACAEADKLNSDNTVPKS